MSTESWPILADHGRSRPMTSDRGPSRPVTTHRVPSRPASAVSARCSRTIPITAFPSRSQERYLADEDVVRRQPGTPTLAGWTCRRTWCPDHRRPNLSPRHAARTTPPSNRYASIPPRFSPQVHFNPSTELASRMPASLNSQASNSSNSKTPTGISPNSRQNCR